MSGQNSRIASYNIRKARGLDQRRDPGRILDVINALEADIVVLQESDHRFGRRKAAVPRAMITAHSDFAVAPLAHREESLGWHGNAVLIRRGMEVSAIERMDLPGFEPRGAAILTLTGDTEFTLVATHLGLRRRDRRAQQMAICAALPKSAAIVVAGDFNEWSTRDGLEPFEQTLTLHAPGPSFPTRLPMVRLDRFAVSGELHVLGTGVADGAQARRASDHLPVWCNIKLPHPNPIRA